MQNRPDDRLSDFVCGYFCWLHVGCMHVKNLKWVDETIQAGRQALKTKKPRERQKKQF